MAEYEEKLLEGVVTVRSGGGGGGVGGGAGGGGGVSRSCSIRRGVTGLVRKVSQKVVNNNKGEYKLGMNIKRH